jgi:penicillin G amidase
MTWLSDLGTNPLGSIARLFRWPLPQVEGKISLRGLGGRVEVLRDRWGVPHIYARDEDDLAFAQGYVHAQDRLWQMELNRRVGRGRLSELFGELAVPTDTLLRTIGIPRAAQASFEDADAESRRALECYARGVNAFIDGHKWRLPIEFMLLRTRPEPWQPVDTLAWGQMMAWALTTNWDSELVNAALLARVGVEKAARLKGEYTQENPIVLPGHTWERLLESFREQFRAAEGWLPLAGVGGMSNNWVIDGHKSKTGKPLLANDPHLSAQMPSIWYENHLICPTLEVTGVSLPGAPGVVIGHNQHIAWGLTAGLTDTADLYVEKMAPGSRDRYEVEGGRLEQAAVLREQLRVRGEEAPREIEIRITRHGPIVSSISPLAESGSGYALALRWVGHEPNHLPGASLKLNRAKNFEEFSEALRGWTAPAMNVVYADAKGGIGYHLAGAVPVRKHGRGLVPVPGWTGEYEWTGYVPHEELPHQQNPAQHFYASANNRIVGPEYPHFLGADHMNGYRARRITELLCAKETLDHDDFARMHVDLFCGPAPGFCRTLTSLRDQILADPSLASHKTAAEDALRRIASWDHVLSPDSVAASIYELVLHHAQRRLFEPWLGDLTEHFCGVGFHPVLNPNVIGCLDRAQLIAMRILQSDDEKDLIKTGTRASILAGALADALTYLNTTLGPRASEWRWGAIHPVAFHHPLGAKKPLDRIFNRGPYPYGGDTNTVWQASWTPRLPIAPEGGFTASWRQIIDCGDWDASRAIHTTGQSGHPASRHYDDMIPMWLRGEYHPMLWSRPRVEENTTHRLFLEP